MKWHGPCPAAGKRGYTLVELLIVSLILAVLISVIGACLAGGVKVWDSVRSFCPTETGMMIGMRMLERDLMNAAPLSMIGFSGEAERVEFPLLLPDGSGRECLKLGTVSYSLDRGRGLVLRKVSAYPASGPEPEAGDAVVSRVHDLSFSFLRREEPASVRGEGEWISPWTDATNWPDRITMTLTVGNAGGEPLVVERTFVLPVTPKAADKPAEGRERGQ